MACQLFKFEVVMAIKKAEEYINSLRDGRVIYGDGVKITDIVRNNHSALKAGLRLAAYEYVLAADPQYRDLLVEANDGSEPYHFAYKAPRTPVDLLRRRQIIQKLARACYGMPGAAHFTGIDALHALGVVTKRMDTELNTRHARRLEIFREECKSQDLGLSCGMVAAPGQQAGSDSHKDFQVRITDESSSGITVNGVMAHITFAPYTHEIIILPAHGLNEDNKNLALSFAVPVNSSGIKLILPMPENAGNNDQFDHPLTSRLYFADSIVVFNNVFIPMDRVFMKGEYRYAGQAARMFASFHRLSADSRKVADLEAVVGAAFLLAEFNGLEKYSHIQDKLAQLVYYAETSEALSRAAAFDCVTDPASGFVFPNPLLSNVAKYTYANYWHEAIKALQDIAGGFVATMPSGKDFHYPELQSTLVHYLAGRQTGTAEYRIKVVNLVRDLSSASLGAASIHGEGALLMQRIGMLREADRSRYLSAARHAAGIEDKSPHPEYAGIPDIPDLESMHNLD